MERQIAEPSEQQGPKGLQQPHEPHQPGWALAAHLSLLVMVVGVPGFLGPLLVFLLKPAGDARAAAEAREALNFGLSLLIYVAGLFVLGIVAMMEAAWGAFGALALAGLALLLASLLLPVIAAVRVDSGEPFRYPLTIRFF